MAYRVGHFSNTCATLLVGPLRGHGVTTTMPHFEKCKGLEVLEKSHMLSAIPGQNGRQLWGPLEAQSCRPFRFEMAYRVGTVSNTFALLTLCLGGPGNTTCLLHLLCYYDYGVLLDICYGN